MNGSRRVIVVSNRLPISVEQVNGEVRVQPSCGGLVSALRPILQEPGARTTSGSAENRLRASPTPAPRSSSSKRSI